ncbi:MAG: preprotein translocase subunit SecE [Ruminococcaceae bacterium]|nr:preprotein translocase subunit SecE [Oscillospiraceae bacterium]
MEIVMSETRKANIFVRAARAIAGYFRELKSELKKVVWPSFKQVRNNTSVVITTIILLAVIVAVLDFAFQYIFSLILK